MFVMNKRQHGNMYVISFGEEESFGRVPMSQDVTMLDPNKLFLETTAKL